MKLNQRTSRNKSMTSLSEPRDLRQRNEKIVRSDMRNTCCRVPKRQGERANRHSVSGITTMRGIQPMKSSSQGCVMAGQGSAGNVVAAVCSFFFPGLGQLVQGRPVTGADSFRPRLPALVRAHGLGHEHLVGSECGMVSAASMTAPGDDSIKSRRNFAESSWRTPRRRLQ